MREFLPSSLSSPINISLFTLQQIHYRPTISPLLMSRPPYSSTMCLALLLHHMSRPPSSPTFFFINMCLALLLHQSCVSLHQSCVSLSFFIILWNVIYRASFPLYHCYRHYLRYSATMSAAPWLRFLLMVLMVAVGVGRMNHD